MFYNEIITVDLENRQVVTDALHTITHRWYHLPEQPSDEEIDRLIDTIGQAILKK